MVVGTVMGVTQSSVKRMLAYSSIAHAGYLLVAIVAANDIGKSALLFYLLVYAVTNVGAFGVAALLGSRDRANDDLKDYAGLWNRQPGLAAVMTIFLLSLGGFPPTAGFVGKWYVFSAAVTAGEYSLALIGVLSSVVSVFFYLRIVVMMYMAEPTEPTRATATHARAALWALGFSVIAVFYLGILPARILDLVAASIGTLL
jgi:NADH-quinone oxidoreductase subunit N